MAVKSIIDVEVSTGAFERFQALFEKYSAKLAEMPGAWKKVGEEQSEISSHFERMTAAILANQQIANEEVDNDDRRNRSLTQASRLWSGMSTNAERVAKSAVMVTGSLLKWGTIIGGGLIGGGLFGIDKLGSAVSGERRSAMGLGTSIGEQKAFGVNFGRLVDPDAFLGNVSSMLTDPRKSWSLSALGVGTSGSTADTAVALLKAMRARALMTGTGQLGLLDAQTGIGAGTDTWRRLHDMKASEFAGLLGGYSRDRSGLGIADPTAQKWADFTNQMERAKSTIFKVFVEGLVPLEKPLEKLSVAFTGLLEKFLTGGAVKQGIDNLANWITGFSDKITSKDFQGTVDRFVSDAGTLADAMHVIAEGARAAGWLTQGPREAARETFGLWGTAASWGSKASGYISGLFSHKGSAAYRAYMGGLGALDSKYGLPAGLLESVKGTESGQSMHPDVSSKGAIGVMQLMPNTARQYGVDPNDPMQSANGAAQFLRDLIKEFGGNLGKAAAAYNWGERNVQRAISQYGDNWLAHAPKETQGYVIRILNMTGGNAIAQVNALAGGQ